MDIWESEILLALVHYNFDPFSFKFFNILLACWLRNQVKLQFWIYIFDKLKVSHYDFNKKFINSFKTKHNLIDTSVLESPYSKNILRKL